MAVEILDGVFLPLGERHLSCLRFRSYLTPRGIASREAPNWLSSNRGGGLLTDCFSLFSCCKKTNDRSSLTQENEPDTSTKVNDPKHTLRDRRLTTAEIIYHLPDHPDLLQSFVWQKLDSAPDFPELRRFLEFWSRNLEGKLHSVRVGQARSPAQSKFSYVRTSLRWH
jgi:uncharacterized protein Usg